MEFFEINLENILFFAHHGLFQHERRDGNEFIVDLSVRYSVSKNFNCEEDDITNSISYVDLFQIVKEEMNIPRNLLETVAATICRRIKRDFPQCEYISCKITKKNPPISGLIGEASVAFSLNEKETVSKL